MNISQTRQFAIPLPGVLVCLLITAASFALEKIEILLFGQAWLESLVLAILLGSAVRTCWSPGAQFLPGIRFSAKTLLETAVVLLGVGVSAEAILSKSAALMGGIVAVVVMSIAASYMIGRAFKLSHRMALLIACGNSICGNSAIAATAPVIGASSEDVTASIAFTAVLGVLVVLGLPLLAPMLGLSATQYGIFAGLTVYAVPQVLAATAPLGALSIQIGTLVKLVRVLMLGPVVLVLALTNGRQQGKRPPLTQLVPWFIIGFLLLMSLRSYGLIPVEIYGPAHSLATLLTIVSMAALGLGVDARCVARAGMRVTGAVALSLLVLAGMSFTVIKLLNLG